MARASAATGDVRHDEVDDVGGIEAVACGVAPNARNIDANACPFVIKQPALARGAARVARESTVRGDDPMARNEQRQRVRREAYAARCAPGIPSRAASAAYVVVVPGARSATSAHTRRCIGVAGVARGTARSAVKAPAKYASSRARTSSGSPCTILKNGPNIRRRRSPSASRRSSKETTHRPAGTQATCSAPSGEPIVATLTVGSSTIGIDIAIAFIELAVTSVEDAPTLCRRSSATGENWRDACVRG